jgi:tetratricopeptide (TPR) repeat protein
LGQVEQAIAYYQQALAIAREIGDRRGEGNHAWNLGLVYEKQGDYAQAAALMQILVDYEREIGHPDAEKDAQYLAKVREKARGSGK